MELSIFSSQCTPRKWMQIWEYGYIFKPYGEPGMDSFHCCDDGLAGGYRLPAAGSSKSDDGQKLARLKGLKERLGIKRMSLHEGCAAMAREVKGDQEARNLTARKAAEAGLEYHYIPAHAMSRPPNFHTAVAMYVQGTITLDDKQCGIATTEMLPPGSVVNYEKGHEEDLAETIAFMVGVHMDPKTSFEPWYGKYRFTVISIGADYGETRLLGSLARETVYMKVPHEHHGKIAFATVDIEKLHGHCKTW